MSFRTFPLAELRHRHSAKWQRFGPEVIPAWVADMDFPMAPPIRDCLAGALQREDFGYPPKGPLDPLPEVFVERMASRYGWHPDPTQVEVIVDVVQGIYITLDRFSAPGEGIVLQTPLYHPFLEAVRETERRLVANSLVFTDQGWQLDLEDLSRAITPDTRILAVCNPHNPSGRVLRRAELEALAEIAEAHDLIVLADEIHADLIYDGQQHLPFASLAPEVEARTITFNSATKAFNTAGIRCAVAAFGSSALQDQFNGVLRRIRGGPVAYGSEVTRVAWQHCQPWLDEALAYLKDNRDTVTRFVAERMPGVRYLPPESTYFAWLDFNPLGLPEDPHSFFLRRAKVGLSEGPIFGAEGEGCARLNFATDRAILLEILERMAAALD